VNNPDEIDIDIDDENDNDAEIEEGTTIYRVRKKYRDT